MPIIRNVKFCDLGDNFLFDTSVVQGICSKEQYEDFKQGVIEKYQLYEYSSKKCQLNYKQQFLKRN